MGFHMPRTPEEFNDYVARELRAGDIRMDEIVKTVAAIQIEQASAKVLLAPTNTTQETYERHAHHQRGAPWLRKISR